MDKLDIKYRINGNTYTWREVFPVNVEYLIDEDGFREKGWQEVEIDVEVTPAMFVRLEEAKDGIAQHKFLEGVIRDAVEARLYQIVVGERLGQGDNRFVGPFMNAVGLLYGKEYEMEVRV